MKTSWGSEAAVDTTSVLGSFAFAGSGNGKSVGMDDVTAPPRKEESNLTHTRPRERQVADLCPGARRYSALYS